MKFSESNKAVFKASGRDGSPSGTEGSFDIVQNGNELAATVSFSVPYWGRDKVDVQNADGSNYVCTPRETTMLYGGPLYYDIVCHKIISP
ncbi:aegerolysin [Heliothis virescens ascovirus 3h]|uniref:Aegerolysin n=1 Tax=Heliothis virescens ascovirus 3h TaxID=1268039 RepID=A0A386JB47_9VIRU|nr:aegerolysin [Heliothis virescens ascovirus 3h]